MATVPETSFDLKDPICVVKVTPQSAHQSVHTGQQFYFCGPKCQIKFNAKPMQYIGKQAPLAAIAGVNYTCPMHPEIRQDLLAQRKTPDALKQKGFFVHIDR